MNAIEPMNNDTTEPTQAIIPIDLVHRAITSGADVVVLEKLMALQERWEANQARKAFDNAIAAAKAEIPEILKTRRVDFKSAKGHTQYSYEDLAEIAKTIAPALGKYGLSYRFRTASSSPDHIAVTCIISHRDGYSEETTLPGAPDASGNKNSIQAIGSAITYLQRYTLKAALGLAASNDDDGQGAGSGSDEQVPPSSQYMQRWQMLMENAMSADSLGSQWNAERSMRARITWFGNTRTQLHDAVMQRIKDLQQADKSPDLVTQRLEAQDT
jgi:hypothetical protein